MRTLFIAIMALIVGIAAPVQAANLTAQLTWDPVGALPPESQSCADGAACDASALTGVVAFATTFGSITVSLGGTGAGDPATTPFEMDLTYSLNQAPGGVAATYTVAVSQTDLSGAVSGWTAIVGGTQFPAGQTVAFSAFADTSNALFGQGTALCSSGPQAAAGLTSLSCSSAGGINDPSFSLTELVTITTVDGFASVGGDAVLTPVPEPATLLLIGSGLAGLGALRRYRRVTGRRRCRD